ncbi:fructose-1,6-bisphosphatase [uncultured Duncaniella sp.]|uniref:fructose-1,6-bisphosphatase n=1 Tax=uncultured Duncaniella sp. TaxID=2768039 RepID=UPI0025AE1528|nr:fructose-1,6-bisphosphatase [uncultured Duncaniella sp.]
MAPLSPVANPQKIESDRRILELLAQTFPSISAASTEIINLEAILNLPKGTEHFVADLHGEHEAFRHILKNASGNIKRKVTDIYGTSLRENEIRQLCSLIYYPEEKLQIIKATESNLENFYNITLHQLVSVCQSVSSKYTRSKVRKALPKEFAYIIEELLHESPSDYDKQAYFNRIIETIISTGQADSFIVSMCQVIQRLSIDQLHILGDVYDRGPGAHLIMDTLCQYGRFDIQWGNHDILWMGAAAGNDCCIANVVRVSLRYSNLATLEDGYGINLLPLATFAMETYADDPCEEFKSHVDKDDQTHSEKTLRLMSKMHKAIAVIQFKLEGAMVDKHPEWKMADRNLLHRIDYTKGTVNIEGKEYKMTDTNFPTIDPTDPYKLTAEERHLVHKLHHSFTVSTALRRHIECLFSHGCMYGVYNSNLLFHASLPLNADGSFKEVEVKGTPYKGKALMHQIGMLVRSAFNDDTPAADKEYASDYYWYLWCGPDSPLFDKNKMTTFERYFVADPDARKEEKGYYYSLREDEKICDMILDEFGVDGTQRHIINGHVPVRTRKGESPIRANGKLMVIDGGFAKAYHKTTGIAGYTLIYHSSNFELVEHEPFSSEEEAIRNGTDIVRSTKMVEQTSQRIRVRDTDKGKILQSQIDELSQLLYAFRHGIIKERGMEKSSIV